MLPKITDWAHIEGAGIYVYITAGEPLLERARQALCGALRPSNICPWPKGEDGIGAVIGDSRLQAVMALGETHDEGVRCRLAPFTTVERLTDDQRHALLKGGDAEDRGGELYACFGVSCAAIEAAIADGAGSLDDVGAVERAGINCGFCRPEIRALLCGADIRKAA